ncbi:MAG: hypothetical protein AAFQ47_08630 [Pseudomonadota bacterium]
MQAVQSGFRSLSLLVDINWDRLLMPSAIVGGLIIGAEIGGFILNVAQ